MTDAAFGPTDRISRRPVRPIGWAAFNATRIEAGRPLFGVDFDDSILPHETGPTVLDRAVTDPSPMAKEPEEGERRERGDRDRDRDGDAMGMD